MLQSGLGSYNEPSQRMLYFGRQFGRRGSLACAQRLRPGRWQRLVRIQSAHPRWTLWNLRSQAKYPQTWLGGWRYVLQLTNMNVSVLTLSFDFLNDARRLRHQSKIRFSGSHGPVSNFLLVLHRY